MNVSSVLTIILLTTGQVALSQAIAAPKTIKTAAVDKELIELRNQANTQRKEVEKLSKEVNGVEVTLALNNKKYLKLAEERHSIEERLTASRKNAQNESEILEQKYNQTKKLMMGVVLNKLENQENSSDILARKILVKKLKNDLTDLESLITENKNAQVELEMMQAKLEESMSIEKELLNVMADLENKKVVLKETLETKTKESEELNNKLKERSAKKSMAEKNKTIAKVREELRPKQLTEKVEKNQTSKNSNVAGGFISPIESYQALDYQNKGVTFNFNGKKTIRASKTGKVVYTGELANYGNVLMIEHGDETRSVLLGQFEYSVKKGDSVKVGQSIGSTKESNTSGISDGKLYFEVRKNNLAQNTYLLLDKNTLAKQ